MNTMKLEYNPRLMKKLKQIGGTITVADNGVLSVTVPMDQFLAFLSKATRQDRKKPEKPGVEETMHGVSLSEIREIVTTRVGWARYLKALLDKHDIHAQRRRPYYSYARDVAAKDEGR